MFTSTDLLSLPYFKILHNDNNIIELQSKNTKHCWKILQIGPNNYDLMHKHHLKHNYHFQCSYPNLFDIVLEIVNHDEFQLRGRKPVKYACQNRNSYFDELIRIYGVYA